MKKYLATFFVYGSLSLLLFSCTEKNTETSGKDSANVPVEIPEHAFDIDTTNSSINWSRSWTEHSEQRTMKLGKGTLTINGGDISATYHGEFIPKEGYLVQKGTEWIKGKLLLDFTTLQVNDKAKNIGELMNVKTPTSHSILNIKKIEQDTLDQYKFTGDLTLGNETKEIVLKGTLSQNETGVEMKSRLVLELKDWDLPRKVKKENIKKDQVTLDMNLFFLKPMAK